MQVRIVGHVVRVLVTSRYWQIDVASVVVIIVVVYIVVVVVVV